MNWTQKFQTFDQKNPQLYQLFSEFTRQLIAAGRKRISHGTIVERIRWESYLSVEDEYKVNQNFGRPMAERFIQENPEHTGLFAFKARVA